MLLLKSFEKLTACYIYIVKYNSVCKMLSRRCILVFVQTSRQKTFILPFQTIYLCHLMSSSLWVGQRHCSYTSAAMLPYTINKINILPRLKVK